MNERNKFVQSQCDNVLERDKIFTKVLLNFANHQEKRDAEQRKQKKAFFWMVCISFFVVIVGCVASIIIISLNDNKSWEDFGVALGSVASLVSVIIVLPSKIAEHLFPADGEKDFTVFFARAHEADLKVGQNNPAANVRNDSESMTYEKLMSILDKYNEEYDTVD